MRTDRLAVLTSGLLAAALALSQAAWARADTVEARPAPATELACDGTADPALAADACSYALPDAGGMLWLVPCIRGSYQTAYNAVVVPEDGAPRRLLFALWRDQSWTGTADLFDPAFDPQTGILSDQYKDRGLGDCGGARRWQWEGSDFRLREYRARSECNGSDAAFPVIFEAPADA